MTYITKPRLHHPKLATNTLGFTRRDYEGAVSTLCAGCGHDSISAAIIQACFELSLPPHRVAKLSGIGCSSKTPTSIYLANRGYKTANIPVVVESPPPAALYGLKNPLVVGLTTSAD